MKDVRKGMQGKQRKEEGRRRLSKEERQWGCEARKGEWGTGSKQGQKEGLGQRGI